MAEVSTAKLARAIRHERPTMWPLRFRVTHLDPDVVRERAAAPRGAGTYLVEATKSVATVRFVPARGGEGWTERFATLDEAESRAAQAALQILGRYKPQLVWRRTTDKRFWGRGRAKEVKFEAEAELDLPIYGVGKMFVPPRGDPFALAEWNGTEPWGHPYNSGMPNTRGAMQAFVDDWLALMHHGVRFYRVFPYILGQDDKFVPGSMRQVRVAELLEAAAKLERKGTERMGERQRAIWTSRFGVTSPIFNWDFKDVGKRWKPVVAEDRSGKGSAEHRGFFEVGQAAGAYEIVEYTTGPKTSAKSLGVWKPPTLEQWRRQKGVGELRPEKVELHRAAAAGFGQLELG